MRDLSSTIAGAYAATGAAIDLGRGVDDERAVVRGRFGLLKSRR